MKFPPLTIGDVSSRLPIIQGGMGIGISMSGLASAVANAGGIGVLSAVMPGMREPDIAKDGRQANIRAMRREIQKTRSMTDGVIGVNIMVALTNYEDMVRTSIEEGVDLIISGAGLPLDLPGYRPEGSRTRLVPIVSSGRAATIICRKWQAKYNLLPDAFVVEGPEAGGHLGFSVEQIDDPAFHIDRLVTDVIAAVEAFAGNGRRIPVIAAGGIYTGKDIHRVMELGADGVQMGTRFVATHECDAADAFKQAYIDAQEGDLTIIKSPVGLPGRVVRNGFIDAIANGEKKPFRCPFKCLKTCDVEKSPYCIAIALANARDGRLKNGFAFAGKNAYRVTRVVSVQELMDSLQTEFRMATLTHHGGLN